MDIFLNVLIGLGIGVILVPLIYLNQSILFKEEKQLKLVTIILIYVVGIVLVAIAENYGLR